MSMKFIFLFTILTGFFTLNAQFKASSVLSDGEIYKIQTKQTGIYKITYSYLKNLGIDIDNTDVSKIKLYGTGGGKLKQLIDDEYIDDLIEIPIYISGDEDGKLNSDDYILFYGEGPDKWFFNNSTGLWQYEKNIYSNSNYYFIKISGKDGKRILDKSVQGVAQYVSGETDVYSAYEEDKLNLLGNYIKTEGSGQEWYGENISLGKEKDFSSYFNDFKYIKEKEVHFKVIFAGRDPGSKQFTAKLNNKVFYKTVSNVNITDPESTYARIITIDQDIISSNNDKIFIKLKYDGESGWIDKIELNARAQIKFDNKNIFLSDSKAPVNSIAGFKIDNINANVLVWDISNPGNISNFPLKINGNYGTFTYNTSESNKFILFSLQNNFLSLGEWEKVENQDLHSISNADMLIVYHKDFERAAQKLAEYRSEHNNFNVYAIELQKIFNEFSGGKYDPTAIRDFVRMLKSKNNKFMYLLLFGDGSFDARGITRSSDNFIPVYETRTSLSPINSFPSDDYFGLISYGEGENLSGKLDISIGRIPVRTSDQADMIVDRIIDYETNRDYYGSWKNNITLCADDVDEEWDITHIKGAESINFNLKNKYPSFNINKIYLDAYIQENNTGGQRYPDANKAINSSIFNGELMFVYVGHGGPKGLAQERVLQKDDINSWYNKTKLPLLITATCSFTGFDDPKVNTIGEVAFLKEKGGVIGLFSTVRAVYSSSNDALMRATFNAFFSPESNRFLPLGDIIRIAKNNTSGIENKRKFLLFGDPALNLSFPRYGIKTTKINNKVITNDSVIIDTLNALEQVNIVGMIVDENNYLVSDFNGEIDVTLFDKPTKLKTFANDFEGKEDLRKEFYLQKNILFKGTARVENGKFSISFILPKDINYKYGRGKISYYAISDNLAQAAGFNNNISIGGTANNIISDNEGPQIQLYMNDTDFAYGGITDRNPVLLGFLEDKSGINITGIGIGHELSAEMDNNTGNKIVLNDFYESEMNNFRKGSFRYPLSKLETGKHLIKVEAWDILNNRSEKIIEFVVVDGNSEKLKHVLNYPNPFSSMTNFRFEHDLPDQELNIVVNIYSMSGKLIKSISTSEISTGYQISDISWDGTDDYGNRLANGIYIYKIKVFSPEYNISRESKFEKLVILR